MNTDRRLSVTLAGENAEVGSFFLQMFQNWTPFRSIAKAQHAQLIDRGLDGAAIALHENAQRNGRVGTHGIAAAIAHIHNDWVSWVEWIRKLQQT